MDQMFDLRPGKLALRREFESLIWKGGEPFCDYYHDKMILANRIPVAEDEIIDYLIEGVPNQRLQNQARLMNYRTGAQLLKVFEKVQLDVKKSNDVRTRKDGARAGGGRFEAPHTKGKPTKCFKCHETGHVAAHCKRIPARRACYGCGSTEHLAKECPKRNQPLTSDAHKDLAWIASTNVIQPVGLPDPYMIRVKIVTETANSGPCSYVVDAMVDSGSPISLVRSDVILGESRSLEREQVGQFYGLNGSRLRIDGVFFGILEVNGVQVKIKFHAVPSDTMAYSILLGRDFLKCPRICVTLGETVRVSGVDEEQAIKLMNIEYNDDFIRLFDGLNINPDIDENVSARIRGAYDSCYLTSSEGKNAH